MTAPAASNDTARRLGLCSAIGTVVLLLAYAITLIVGLSSLASPRQPIGDPMFTMLEVLILALVPVMLALLAAIHASAPPHHKPLGLLAVVFMAMLGGLTGSVHFAILTLSRQAAFAGQPWLPRVLSFEWPSVAYALDILAWDVFFPLSMLFAAPLFAGSRLATSIRGMMIASALLALAGLSGVVTGDMRLRNVGIVGYVGVFLIVASLLAVWFARAEPDARDRYGSGSET